MFHLHLSYLTVIGVLYLLIAAYNAVFWAKCSSPILARLGVSLPRFRHDRHSLCDVLIGVGHIFVDVVIHVPW
jgi:hypothetical protein